MGSIVPGVAVIVLVIDVISASASAGVTLVNMISPHTGQPPSKHWRMHSWATITPPSTAGEVALAVTAGAGSDG